MWAVELFNIRMHTLCFLCFLFVVNLWTRLVWCKKKQESALHGNSFVLLLQIFLYFIYLYFFKSYWHFILLPYSSSLQKMSLKYWVIFPRPESDPHCFSRLLKMLQKIPLEKKFFSLGQNFWNEVSSFFYELLPAPVGHTPLVFVRSKLHSSPDLKRLRIATGWI